MRDLQRPQIVRGLHKLDGAFAGCCEALHGCGRGRESSCGQGGRRSLQRGGAARNDFRHSILTLGQIDRLRQWFTVLESSQHRFFGDGQMLDAFYCGPSSGPRGFAGIFFGDSSHRLAQSFAALVEVSDQVGGGLRRHWNPAYQGRRRSGGPIYVVVYGTGAWMAIGLESRRAKHGWRVGNPPQVINLPHSRRATPRMLDKAMRGSILIICSAIACLHAQSDPGDLLQRVTKKVLDTVGRLPKYMCTQTVDRSQYNPTVGTAGRKCEPYARNQLRLTTTDRLRLDVAVTGGREMYSWVAESRFEDRSLFELVNNGAMSTGSFASFLMVVFRDDEASFSYQGERSEGGRQLAEFEFRVPVESSHYIFNGAGNRVTTGYFGSVLVDPQTADLVRLVVHTEALPPETGSCESSTTLDYSRVRLNGAEFLLPGRAQLHILDASGLDMENSTVYSGCHEFLGESTLRFDSGPELGQNGESKSGAAEDLPIGLPFTIALTNNISQSTAAAGDKVTAKLTTAITDAKRVLIPKGAAVTARIVQIRRYYVPENALRLVLKLETIDVGGAPRPFTARPDARPPVVAVGKGALQRRGSPVMVRLDNQDPQAAVLTFSDTRGNFAIGAGFESKWLTAAR
jgi:hypothetical protein